MSKQVKPGLYELERPEEVEESLYSLSDEEIKEFEREVLTSGLDALLPSITGRQRTVGPEDD